MLQDSCGDLQQTSRDDIITDNDDISAKIDEGSPVIALHPNYYFRSVINSFITQSRMICVVNLVNNFSSKQERNVIVKFLIVLIS